ncbi:MAG: SUMF1/EgtB/PvdO family nonheme iron enzyme [Acidobacteria bacterium]|nr:SUMF1/EgtB/PvdO family nonheme iron enzyme [Acidobacteriota bacterium]
MTSQPSHVGRYQVLRRLGVGGMGDLYLARDSGLDRLVAIKLLKEDLSADPGLRERFAREARAVARLRHPNVVTVFDVGEVDGRPFIAMEYIAGESLAEMVRRRAPLSLSQKLSLIAELCSGLAHAHQAGIVHRDVKPGNAMVDQDGTLRVVDFGIAQLGESTITRQGEMVGTVNYMSPEQLKGSQVDYRSDVFGVGAVFYELLTFKKAFPGTIADGVLDRILRACPEPPSRICENLDGRVDPIIARALDKDPCARYPDLLEMRRDLEALRECVEDSMRPAEVRPAGFTEHQPATPSPTPGRDRRTTDVERLLRRRREEIEGHLRVGVDAIERGDYRVAIEEAERAATIDPQEERAHDLIERARAALDTAEVRTCLSDARRSVERRDFTEATALADRAAALVRRVASDALEQELEQVRADVERARENARKARAAIDRAMKRLEEGAYESAIRSADEALAIEPTLEQARLLVERARAGIEARACQEQSRAIQGAVEAPTVVATCRETVTLLDQAPSIAPKCTARSSHSGETWARPTPTGAERASARPGWRMIAAAGGVVTVLVVIGVVLLPGRGSFGGRPSGQALAGDAVSSSPRPQVGNAGEQQPAIGTAPAVQPMTSAPVESAAADPDQRLAELRTLAREQFARGEKEVSLRTLGSVLQVKPADADALRLFDELHADALVRVTDAKKRAAQVSAPTLASGEYQKATDKLDEGNRLGRTEQAVRALWAASTLFAAAVVDADRVATAARAGTETARQTEESFWESIKDLRSPDRFDEYITRYPQGSYRTIAEARLKELRADAPTPPPSAVSLQASEAPASLATIVPPAATAKSPVPGVQWAHMPAGTFQMGCVADDPECSEAEKPDHSVTLSAAFDLMTTEVTVGVFRRYAGALGQTMPQQPKWSRLETQPVVNVTHGQAAGVCRWLGGRLPTEAEWEYAARGGLVGKRYPWGDEKPTDREGARNGARFANTKGAVAVGSYAPNGYGLYDMAGNVSEFVQDLFALYPGSGERKPAFRTDPVARGGSWYTRAERFLGNDLRVSDRRAVLTFNIDSGAIGCRCARDIAR